jgi:hypothetical protein
MIKKSYALFSPDGTFIAAFRDKPRREMRGGELAWTSCYGGLIEYADNAKLVMIPTPKRPKK